MKFQISVVGLLCVFLFTSGMNSTATADVLYGVSYNHSQDFPGSDFSTFKAPSLESCIKTCSNEPNCKAFSFEAQARICRMKNQMGRKVKKRGVTSGYKLSTLREGNDNRVRHSSNMDTMRGVNLPGSDYHHFLSRSVSKCSDRCERDSKCRAFTYHKIKGACWLKSGVPGKRYEDSYISGVKISGGGRTDRPPRGGRDDRYSGSRTRGSDRYSGSRTRSHDRYDEFSSSNRDRFDWSAPAHGNRGGMDPVYQNDRSSSPSRSNGNGYKMAIMKKVNMQGGDYTRFKVKKTKHCSRQCLNDPQCVAFTFNVRARTCWLKSVRTSEEYKAGYVSGVKVRR
jgi:hypothetical protein